MVDIVKILLNLLMHVGPHRKFYIFIVNFHFDLQDFAIILVIILVYLFDN